MAVLVGRAKQAKVGEGNETARRLGWASPISCSAPDKTTMLRRLCSPKDSLPRKVSSSEERGETAVFAGYQNKRFLEFIPFILSPRVNPRQSWILDSRYLIPVFVSGTWILDSNPL